ncbi:hydroxymyristoyl-ACP dehydratase [Yersinia entomophaga]|uniref:Hydroxymyristoyl-ACP dehydratase n=1 Tax=Yersinia entomophaga TaxID=935293 RepID=A0ABN4Q1S8_YERET|nr:MULTISPECIES: hydroxymyristoyl-ACP dehydratase [Yersinia]ANI31760.1 hydroxymyristoyl-ACP dehydratase [Yersinia entomophaga]OWF85398.1 hydroxymyristoyl-ACP dehydratase [Yersinia entomophaga]
MKPVELSRQQSERHQMEVRLYLDPKLSWFTGHFDVQPLLPGVAQIDWVMGYAADIAGAAWQFSGIDKVKFQLPLLPGNQVLLRLDWNESRGLLSFSYTLDEGVAARTASSGAIKLCR